MCTRKNFHQQQYHSWQSCRRPSHVWLSRLVIVNEVGNLMGVVTPDDLLELVGEHRGTLASLMREDRQGH